MEEKPKAQNPFRRLLNRFVLFNPAYCNPAWQGLSLTVRMRPAFIEGLSRLALFIGKEVIARRIEPRSKHLLVAVGSQNNLRSAEAALIDRVDVEIVSFHNLRLAGRGRIPFLSQYLTGLWILPLVPLLLLFEKRAHVRKAIVARLDALVLTMGWGGGIRRYLRRAKPDVVILMSTLSSYHCLIIEQAARLRLPTIFMTHAPLGRGQPPLPTAYALLDGDFQRSLFPPSGTRFAITGSGRGAALVAHARDRSQASGVLIATNTLMRNLTDIEALIGLLRQRYGEDLPVVLRPHPADRARLEGHRALARRTHARFQNPNDPLWSDVDDCKFLVSTQSGVVLDALLLGFFPLIIRSPDTDRVLSQGPADYYGFAELDVAREIELANPWLPLDWDARRNVALLEKAASPSWDTHAAINRELDTIIARAANKNRSEHGHKHD